MRIKPHTSPLARILTQVLILLLALTTGTATAFAEGSLKAARGEILLTGADGQSFVQPPSGERVELPLPKGSRVTDFRSVSEDWLVAAVSRADGEPKLELLHGRAATVAPLPSPAVEPVAELAEPMFLADRHGFQALVWLAGNGDDKVAVKAARWLAGGWGATETVSPPGTQIALATAILADGTWLVVWSAFDGQDDEIVWSRFEQGVWSEPRPIAENNAVPDVTPSLHATADGALAAWSRYDGNDYRVNVARFDGEGWSKPMVAGPAGSIDPMFSAGDEPYVIYRHAAPPGWAVLALDAAGDVVREAGLPAAEWRRPHLANVSDQGARLGVDEPRAADGVEVPRLGGSLRPPYGGGHQRPLRRRRPPQSR